MTLRLGVLISGRGSNFQAIATEIQSGDLDASIGVVISNEGNAPGLDLAGKMGIPAIGIDPQRFDSRDAYEAEVVAQLRAHEVEWVVLAGYMKLVGRTLLNAFKHRIINIHPSLLPSFKGLDAQKQALEYGVKVSGCTVHIVTAKMDDGPILGQRVVPVFEDDTVDSLTQRILVQEHQLLPEVIQSIANQQFIKKR